MNARTCMHTKIRVHVLTSIEAERGREREKERVKRTRRGGRKAGGEGRGCAQRNDTIYHELAMERSIRQRQQHFFEYPLRHPGP